MKTYIILEEARDNIKVYGAILTGLDQKYGFNRIFKSYRYLSSCSSKHAYYNYYIDVEEGQIFEVSIKSAYKNQKYYNILENGEFKKIELNQILLFFRG